MSESLSTAFTLMAIGMITVFLVLAIVVISGNVMISLVNRFVSVEEQPNGKKADQQIKPSVLAAITAAVEVYTKGKGRITKIEKIKQ